MPVFLAFSCHPRIIGAWSFDPCELKIRIPSMNLESIAEFFRRCGQFGGNIFVLVFVAFLVISTVIYVLLTVFSHH